MSHQIPIILEDMLTKRFSGHEITPKERVVFVGLDNADKDIVALIRDHGRIVYEKTMLTKTILEPKFMPEECRIALSP